MVDKAAIARENGKKGGRPKGTLLTKISEAKASKLYAEEKTPLDVMLNNMWYWWSRAKNSSEAAERFFERVNTPEFMEAVKDDQEKFLDAIKQGNKLLAQVIAYRDKAQACAVEAAPYCHHRFATIAIDPKAHGPARNVKFSITIGSKSPVEIGIKANGHADAIEPVAAS